MFARITIFTNGSAYHTEWDEMDELSIEDSIKDDCYSLVDNDQTAVVNVELLRSDFDIDNGLNIPDGQRAGQFVSHIDDLVFIYDDKTEKLKMITSRLIHKSLTTK